MIQTFSAINNNNNYSKACQKYAKGLNVEMRKKKWVSHKSCEKDKEYSKIVRGKESSNEMGAKPSPREICSSYQAS